MADSDATHMAMRRLISRLLVSSFDEPMEWLLLKEARAFFIRILQKCGRHHATEPLHVFARVTHGVIHGERLPPVSCFDAIPMSPVSEAFNVLQDEDDLCNLAHRVHHWLISLESRYGPEDRAVVLETVTNARVAVANVCLCIGGPKSTGANRKFRTV